MTQKTEIEALREEIAALRKEVETLRAGQVVHHYHHQAAPAPFTVAPSPYAPAPRPTYPGGPYPVTCGGEAVGIGWLQNAIQ